MNSFVAIISSVLLCLSIIITLLQQVRRNEWWVRVSDFPHVQLLILTSLSWMVLLVALNDIRWFTAALLLAGLATIVYQWIIVWPYTRMAKPQVADSVRQSEDRVSLLEANVFMENGNYNLLSDCLKEKKPDLFIGLETGESWCAHLIQSHPEYSYRMEAPLNNTYGMILMSKFPLEDEQIHYRVEEDVPAFSAKVRLPSNKRIQLHVLHPAPPSPTENDSSTERDAEILMVAKEVKNSDLPVIVAGDLNDVAWSHSTRLFQRISGLLDPRIGRGLYNTFHAKWALMRWPLDHIFHSRHFTLDKMERCEEIGSDHFPMYISLDLAVAEGEEHNISPEDHDYSDSIEAKRKVEMVK